MPVTRLFCKTVAISLVLLLFRTNGVAAQPLGLITVSGEATINNTPAVSGQTIFDDSTIKTTYSASLTLDMPRSTRLEVAEETELNVKLSNASLETVLKSGQLTCSTLQGTATRVEIVPGLTVRSNPSLASQFTITKKDQNYELSVSSGAVDVLDARENSKAAITHVGPGTTLSNAGLTQTNQDGLSKGKRTAIFLAAGGALALIFLIVVTGNGPGLEGPGCLEVSGTRC